MSNIARLIEGVPIKFIDNGDGSSSISSSGSSTSKNYPTTNASVSSYDSFSNPLVIVYTDPLTHAVLATQTNTYDGSGRLLTRTMS